MPLIDLQRRLYEIGRIRLGSRSGPKGAPKRLTKFRFTSTSDQAIDKIVNVYGGTREVWADAPTEQRQFQCFTDADELDVVIPPTSMAISQHYEHWSGGGVQRRCDGNREIITDQPCLCAREMDDGQERLCKPTTRLNVMLPRAWGLGVWRLETSGWNAAAELAGAAELAQIASQRGQLSSARLRLETRTKKTAGQTHHFVVPVLDLDLPLQGLQAPNATFTPVDQDALPAWPTPPLEDQLRAVDSPEPSPPRKNQAAPIPPTEIGIEADGIAVAPAYPPSPTPAQMGLVDEATRKSIAIVAREAGLDDDQRHVFLLRFSDGAYESTKDVPVKDVPALRAELIKLKHDRTKTTRGIDVPARQADLEEVRKAREVVDVPLPGDDQWTADRWKETLKHVQGIGDAKLMRKAREISSDMGTHLPQSLGDIQDPHLITQLLAWLKSHRDAQTEDDPDERPF